METWRTTYSTYYIHVSWLNTLDIYIHEEIIIINNKKNKYL